MSIPTLEQMLEIEESVKEKGFTAICGVDEVGVGPLAGPVYAAAVILDWQNPIEGLYDSKALSEKKREALYPEILEKSVSWAIASVDEGEIDAINILQARLKAMALAVAALDTAPDFVLIDGTQDPGLGIASMLIKGGDAKSASIAAASILAKVARDRYMVELAPQYPQYHFEKHKGYATRLHIQMVREHGPCKIHRKSFLTRLGGQMQE